MRWGDPISMAPEAPETTSFSDRDWYFVEGRRISLELVSELY